MIKKPQEQSDLYADASNVQIRVEDRLQVTPLLDWDGYYLMVARDHLAKATESLYKLSERRSAR